MGAKVYLSIRLKEILAYLLYEEEDRIERLINNDINNRSIRR